MSGLKSRRATIYIREGLSRVLGDVQLVGLSQRITAVATRYEALVRACMPGFSKEEWCAIMDANNGGSDLWLGSSDGTGPGPSMIWANLHDSPGMGEKWGVDQAELVSRLQSLAPAQLWAVDEAIARFWARPGLDTDEALEAAWCRVAGTESSTACPCCGSDPRDDKLRPGR